MLTRIWSKGNSCALLVGMQIGAATMENIMEVPPKIKVDIPYDPEIPFLGIYLKKTKNTNLKRYMHPRVHCSIIYNHQDMQTT